MGTTPLITKQEALSILVALLRPIAAFCVRHGLKLSEAIESLKSAFIQAGMQESEGTASKSQLSLMTGVHRADVSRLLDAGPSSLSPILDITNRVLGRWQTDRRFCSTTGMPRPLGIVGRDCEFARLVRSVTKDTRHKPILSELQRSGSVAVENDFAYVTSPTYTPRGDASQRFEVASVDQDALLRSAEENILQDFSPRHLQSRTEFDRVRADEREEIAHWMLKKGHQLHSEARDFLAQFDQEVSPKAGYQGGFIRVVLGTFGYVHRKK